MNQKIKKTTSFILVAANLAINPQLPIVNLVKCVKFLIFVPLMFKIPLLRECNHASFCV